MRRLVPSAIVALASMWILAPTANAVAPERETVAFTDDGTFPSDVCGFVLRYHVEGEVTFTIFVDADGQIMRARSTGPIRATFSDDETGETTSYPISGPGFYDETLTLVRGTGNWATFTEDGDFVIASGDAMFGDTPEMHGHTRSVCADLG